MSIHPLSPRAQRFLALADQIFEGARANKEVSDTDYLAFMAAIRRHAMHREFVHQPLPTSCWVYFDQFMTLAKKIRNVGGLVHADLENLESSIEVCAQRRLDRTAHELRLQDRPSLYESADARSEAPQ